MQEMKNYYIVNSETKIIENVVVATEDVAKDMGLDPNSKQTVPWISSEKKFIVSMFY